jgi:hypothetical protein
VRRRPVDFGARVIEKDVGHPSAFIDGNARNARVLEEDVVEFGTDL